MKKITLLALAALTAGAANAQSALAPASLTDNISLSIDGGVTTPMTHHAFFGSMRGATGLTIQKQITPTYAVGVEGNWGINTSSWSGMIPSSTAFDSQYVGAYGAVNLMNLFGGYPCHQRPFEMEVLAGAGWGHYFVNEANGSDWNYFGTKVGVNFNFNVSDAVAFQIKPSINWNMSDAPVAQTSAAYDINKATVNIMAGVKIKFGDGFECVTPYDAAQVNALNEQVNALRANLANAEAAVDAQTARVSQLQQQLVDCMNRPVPVITETLTQTDLQSVRFVFFKLASSKITPDQQPNVEMIADYMKHNPNSRVVIKGYASQDGNLEYNIKLAQSRAEAVKTLLISKYGISSDRITAEGEGIGHMFKEESWNRVSICTIDD